VVSVVSIGCDCSGVLLGLSGIAGGSAAVTLSHETIQQCRQVVDSASATLPPLIQQHRDVHVQYRKLVDLMDSM